MSKNCYKWIQGVPLKIQGVQDFYFLNTISQNCSNWVNKVSGHKRIFPGCQKNLFEVDTGCITQNTGCSRFFFLKKILKIAQIGYVRCQFIRAFYQDPKNICSNWIQGDPLPILGVQSVYIFLNKITQNYSN